MATLKIRLWRQHPPKEMWVLRVIINDKHGDVIVRTWFPDYVGGEAPPREVVEPLALTCERIARAALAADGPVVEKKYTLEIRQ